MVNIGVNIVKFILVCFLFFSLQSCGLSHKNLLNKADVECKKALNEGVYKDRYEMSKKCNQPKEREILSNSPDFDLLLLKQAKYNNIATQVKKGKVTEEKAELLFAEFNSELTQKINERSLQRAQIYQQQQIIENNKYAQEQALINEKRTIEAQERQATWDLMNRASKNRRFGSNVYKCTTKPSGLIVNGRYSEMETSCKEGY